MRAGAAGEQTTGTGGLFVVVVWTGTGGLFAVVVSRFLKKTAHLLITQHKQGKTTDGMRPVIDWWWSKRSCSKLPNRVICCRARSGLSVFLGSHPRLAQSPGTTTACCAVVVAILLSVVKSCGLALLLLFFFFCVYRVEILAMGYV